MVLHYAEPFYERGPTTARSNAEKPGGVALGFTDPKDLHHPYVANDLPALDQYTTFVYEVGNALALLTGKYHVSWLTGEKSTMIQALDDGCPDKRSRT